MSGFGVRNAYGSLERVIVHGPGPELGYMAHRANCQLSSCSKCRAVRTRVRSLP